MLPLATRVQPRSHWVFATLVAMACMASILVAGMTVACLRHYAHRLAAKKLGLGPEGGVFSHQEYQVREKLRNDGDDLYTEDDESLFQKQKTSFDRSSKSEFYRCSVVQCRLDKIIRTSNLKSFQILIKSHQLWHQKMEEAVR